MSNDSDSSKETASGQNDPNTGEQTPASTDKPKKPGKSTSAKTGKVLDELASKNKPKAGGKIRRRTSNGGQGALLLFVIVLLPILAAALYVAYQQYLMRDTVSQLQQANQTLTTTLQNQTATLADMERQLAQPAPQFDSAPLQQTDATLRGEIQRLQQQLAQLESQQVSASAAPDFGWKLQEAEYLVNLASQKLELEADISGAIALLQSADNALTESGRAGIFNARQAVAEDLTLLQSLSPLDRDGLYLRLGTLANSAASINLLTSMRQSFENQRSAQSTPALETAADNNVLEATLDFLSEVFIWREWDERPEAMLASGQEAVIKQNLSLHFKQAQLALLDRNTMLYQRSLQDARQLLERYAVTNSTTGQSVLAEINALAALDIDPALPTLEQSLAAVRQLADSER